MKEIVNPALVVVDGSLFPIDVGENKDEACPEDKPPLPSAHKI